MHTIRILPCAVLSLFVSGHIAAESAQPTTDEILARLTALEKQVEHLTQENRQLREKLGGDPKTATPPVFVRPAGKEAKISVGGFVHLNGETGGAPDARWNGINDRIFVRRARLGVSGSFAERFSFKLEGDFGNNSLSGRSGYSAQMTDGFLTWAPSPMASVRVGQFKTPFGYEQLLSDTKTFAIERSLPNDRLTISRQIGAGLFGDLVPKRLSYSTGLFNGNGVNNGNNDNDGFVWVGRLNGVLLEGGPDESPYSLAAGINGFTGRYDGTFTGRRNGLGLDLELEAGPASVAAEWLRNDSSPDTGADSTADGWSVLGAWLFAPRWQGMLRYETYRSNTGLPDTTSRLWTVGGSYLIKGDDIKFSLNYLFGDPAGAESDQRLLGRLQVVY